MSLTQWNAFVEVCRTGSLRAAAEATGFSQPALSRQVAALERTVGARLLDRGSRGVTPTTAGEALLPHARLVVNEARRGGEAARRANTGGRQLLIGAVPSAKAALVPRAVRTLTQAEPSLTWTVLGALTPQLVEMVRSREVDAAVVTDTAPGLPSDRDLRSRLLLEDEMVVVVPAGHRLAGSSRVAIEDLAEEPWIEDNPGSEAVLNMLSAQAGFEARLLRGVDDLLTKTALVAAGLGVCLVPRLVVQALRPDLVILGLQESARRGVFLVTRAGDDPHEDLAQALIAAAG